VNNITKIARVNVAEVQAALVDGKVQVVDLRPSFDFAGGRIPGSVSLPHQALASRPEQLDRTRRILFVSEHGSEADDAAQLALTLGFTDIAIVEGGFDAWLDAGYPVHTLDDGS
jgi:rhodanese-related sulfurtransferase